MVIVPTVGRVVWYHPSPSDNFPQNNVGEPHAAIVARVWDDRMVNLCVIDANGQTHPKTSVPLVQEGDDRPVSMFCEWMPYQVGQAKKHAAV